MKFILSSISLVTADNLQCTFLVKRANQADYLIIVSPVDITAKKESWVQNSPLLDLSTFTIIWRLSQERLSGSIFTCSGSFSLTDLPSPRFGIWSYRHLWGVRQRMYTRLSILIQWCPKVKRFFLFSCKVVLTDRSTKRYSKKADIAILFVLRSLWLFFPSAPYALECIRVLSSAFEVC